ncbi:hypothetical protein GUITHDRAFT_134290 [Guillardia theta CCMP2712]|uniref:TraB domain-containing protein n=1 Tax=Guillardia theta (strain CCMP2712) TaxID=905079 RepID=L1JUU5_GUITC|nr:hypothetical protein GUITHDRAFT_134290 [Guillardia theta CCMP2712]EKX51980.1 hypothetical protein GUITHDRAFT_134290 [Guillardia theta CCMP2712]|eukprot:XP_005838960.1 hypothetical protein GUITHDRAFT_134290 [Guillardia theta CCMP2712]
MSSLHLSIPFPFALLLCISAPVPYLLLLLPSACSSCSTITSPLVHVREPHKCRGSFAQRHGSSLEEITSSQGGASRRSEGAGHSVKTFEQHVEPEEIFVVGTSHISRKSAEDVDRVIRAVRPDNVVVELCRSRAGIMYADGGDVEKSNALSIWGNDPIKALSRSISLGGPVALLLRVLLARNPVLQQTLKETGIDFRAARKAAEDVGATIVLGDRPIEITIERAFRSLSKQELFQDKDILEGLEKSLAESYPSLLEPLIVERDIFLSLTAKSSMAVNGCKRVVAVVGKGHAKGVMRCLSENHNGKFKVREEEEGRDEEEEDERRRRRRESLRWRSGMVNQGQDQEEEDAGVGQTF